MAGITQGSTRSGLIYTQINLLNGYSFSGLNLIRAKLNQEKTIQG